MSATKNGTGGVPATAPTTIKTWEAGNGEVEQQEWPLGVPSDLSAEYAALKAAAIAGDGTQSLEYRAGQGRASLVKRIVRKADTTTDGYSEDVTVVEELYAVDVLKDISEAPYFATDLSASHPLYSKQNGKGEPVTAEQLVWVRDCVENRLTTDRITSEAKRLGLTGNSEWEDWTTLMKELRYHLSHGVETFFETGFVLRRSLYGVRTSAIKASFASINTVVAAPTFKSQMDQLLGTLPTGEWLYKPPQAEHLGRGRWRVTQEWQWSESWSIMYGGTWNGTT